jgi:hypothetical protein
MSEARHYITKCSCGNVIAQCRCASPNKDLTVVERGCVRCHNSGATVARTESQNGTEWWRVGDRFGDFVTLSVDDWKHVNSVIHEHYHGEA